MVSQPDGAGGSVSHWPLAGLKAVESPGWMVPLLADTSTEIRAAPVQAERGRSIASGSVGMGVHVLLAGL
jgi:hypothetical protein